MSRVGLTNFVGRGVPASAGLVLLQADGLRNPFITLIGTGFAVGPLVTTGPVLRALRGLSNAVSRRVVGRELFRLGGKSGQREVVFRQDFGNPRQGSTLGKDESWSLAKDFALRPEEDWRSFPFTLKAGQAVKGYLNAKEEVWAYILTASSFNSFEREEPFQPLWDAPGNHSEVDFVAGRPGIYYLVVANFNLEDDSRRQETDNDVCVELRLNF